MRGGAKLVQDLRRDELMRAEFRPAVHDPMAYGHRSGVDMFLGDRGEGGKGITLRLVNSFADDERVAAGRENP